MKINELRAMYTTRELTSGTHEVLFEGIKYVLDETEDVKGVFVKVRGTDGTRYKDLYLALNKSTFYFERLLEQLKIESFDDNVINQSTGTAIKVNISRNYVDDRCFINADFDATKIAFNQQYQ